MLVKKTKKTPIKKEKVVTKIMITTNMSSTTLKTLFKDNLFNKGIFLILLSYITSIEDSLKPFTTK